MAKQQSRKPAKDADKIGASEANQPARKGEHQPRQREPRTRSGRVGPRRRLTRRQRQSCQRPPSRTAPFRLPMTSGRRKLL